MLFALSRYEITPVPVADPGGAPPYGPKFSQFHAVFQKKIGKIVCWHLLEGWRHLLQGILDPPLSTLREFVLI